MAKAWPKTAKKGSPAAPKIGKGGGRVDYAMQKDVAIVVGLAVIAVATLWPVVTCDFVNYDDHWYVTANVRVQQGLTLANIGWAFTQASGYWVPIDVLSHMLDCQLFGMNPSGHHAANLAYHVCNTVLLFVLLRRMTGQRWCSALAAGLFAIHPQNVEPVAWVTGRKDVLSTLLGLLALLAYARYAAGPGLRRYVPVIVLFTLSLMVKPAFAPFPVVLLFLDYWPLKRMEELKFSSRDGRRRCYRLVLEKMPLFAVMFGFVALGYVTQSRVGSLGSSETYPFATRVANAATSYVMYIWNVFWPAHLAACYPYPAAVWWKTAGALMLLAILTAAAFLGRKRFAYVFVGWFWYGLALTPASGLGAQIGNMPRSDRFAYVPVIGLFIAMAWGLGAVVRRWRPAAVTIPVIVVAALAAYATAAHVQVRYWSDSATLFRHAINVTSDNYMAYSFLGKTLADLGRDEEAVAALTEALRILPHFVDAYNNLGNVQYKNGLYREAVGHFTEALRGSPRDATFLHNMGLALLAQDKCDEAIAYFRRAVAVKPDFALAHNNLGYGLARKGALEEAVVEYREALRIEPKSALVLYNMGDALLAQGKCEEAIQCYTHAAEADPEKRHEALNRIGEALVRQGKSDEAVAYFRQAIAAKPDFALAHNNLGYELARKGALTEAVAAYRDALRADPKCTLALNNWGHILADRGEPNEAANLFRKVIEIDPKDRFAYYNLAAVVAGQGKIEDAVTLYQKALDNAPGNADIANDLGVALVRLGRVDNGITWFRKAIEIDPRAVSARVNWGRVLAGQKRYAEACEQFAEALKISSQSAPAQEALEAARRAMQSQGK